MDRRASVSRASSVKKQSVKRKAIGLEVKVYMKYGCGVRRYARLHRRDNGQQLVDIGQDAINRMTPGRSTDDLSTETPHLAILRLGSMDALKDGLVVDLGWEDEDLGSVAFRRGDGSTGDGFWLMASVVKQLGGQHLLKKIKSRRTAWTKARLRLEFQK